MKTIKQAAEMASEKTIKGAFIAGCAFAQRWYSIDDELPPNGSSELLVKWLDKNGDTKYGLASYINFFSLGLSKAKYMDFIIQGSCKRQVTHWRPINYL